MKILWIAWKSLLEQVRDYKTLLMSFSFPISFIIIFGWMLGSSYYTYKVMIINNDSGGCGVELVERIKTASYEDGTRIFKIKEISERNEVGKSLEKHKYAALIVIPERFTSAVEGGAAASPTRVEVTGDPGFPSFGIVKLGFDTVLDSYLKNKTGYSNPVASEARYIGSESTGSEFNYLAPGLMLMAIYMLLIQVAMVIAQEVENGTIIRLKMSNIKTWELLAGISCSQVVFSAVMVPLTLGSALMVGFQSKGSLLLGTFFGILAAVSGVAIALIVAAFSKTQKEAFLWGNIILIPIIFLSGIFFPMPEITLFKIGSNIFTLFDLMPPTHAHKAFIQIFLYGAGLGDLWYELTMLIIVTMIYFLAGAMLFKKMRMKN